MKWRTDGELWDEGRLSGPGPWTVTAFGYGRQGQAELIEILRTEDFLEAQGAYMGTFALAEALRAIGASGADKRSEAAKAARRCAQGSKVWGWAPKALGRMSLAGAVMEAPGARRMFAEFEGAERELLGKARAGERGEAMPNLLACCERYALALAAREPAPLRRGKPLGI